MNLTRCVARLSLVVALCAALAAGVSGTALAGGDLVAASAAERLPLAQTISLELKGADIRDALDSLAKLTGTNIIADHTVQGNVTVTLNDVPFKQALDLIIKANGFNYRWTGNILIVARNDRLDEALEEPVVEAFALRYAKAKDVAGPVGLIVPPDSISVDERTETLICKGSPKMLAAVRQLLRLLDVERKSPEVAPKASPEPEPAPVPVAEPPVLIKVYDLKYAALEDVRGALAQVLPAGAISVGRKDRTLVVRGTDEEQVEVGELIATLDTPARQVVIEARLEEVALSGKQELGIDWTLPLTLEKDPQDVMRITRVVSDFQTTLNALETTGDAKLLANPRVTVVDGKEASVHIGERIPIVIEQVSEGKVTETVQFIDVGILLKVAPKLNGDNTLTVEVNPEVSSIEGWSAKGYPTISTRTAKTTMTLKDGETVALGGLIQDNKIVDRRKVPFFGDIPLLGALFTTKIETTKKTEVVIFLTPRVVPAAALVQ